MWGIDVSISLIAVEAGFLIAYYRRVHGMPLSRRRKDRRAWYYGLGFLIVSVTLQVVQIVFAFLDRPR